MACEQAWAPESYVNKHTTVGTDTFLKRFPATSASVPAWTRPATRPGQKLTAAGQARGSAAYSHS